MRSSVRLKQSQRRASRRAAAIMVALLAVLIVGMVALVLVQHLAGAHHKFKIFQRQSQALWLAESALARGKARLAADASYAGETWLPATGADSGDPAAAAAALGRAVIQVETDPTDPSRRILRVETFVPDDPIQRVRQTRQQIIHLKPAGESS